MSTRKKFVILRRSAKNDKLGGVSQTVGAIHESPVNFDVILRNNTKVVPYS